MVEITYLIPLLFDFYIREFKPFPDLEIQKFNTQQECIKEMNKQNKKYEIEFSAIRVVCVIK
jgi:hypothetical protein